MFTVILTSRNNCLGKAHETFQYNPKTPSLFFLMTNGVFPAISMIRQAETSQPSWPFNCEFLSPEEPSKNNACYQAIHWAAASAHSEHWRTGGRGGWRDRGRCEKNKQTNRIPAPESWDSCERKGFSEPRLLHLPLHRKAQNSFSWHTWFPIINNFLMFRLPAPCRKLLHNLTPPPLPYTHTSSDKFSQGHLRCYLRGLTPQTFPPNKI